jgi:hypothetical protein
MITQLMALATAIGFALICFMIDVIQNRRHDDSR